MPQQINSSATAYRTVESDYPVFSSTKDGASSVNATPTIERNPDIGTVSDTAATDATGNKTGISLWKGILTFLSTISGRTPALGQATMTGSVPVTIASNQTALPIADNGGSLTVDGTVAATQSGTWNVTNISGTISLPTGAATETTLASLNTKTPALGQAAMAGSIPVAIASNQSALSVAQSGTWNISNVSGTISLPTGAATDTSVLAVRDRLPSALIGGRLGVDVSFPSTQQVSIAAGQSVQVSSVPVQLGAGATTATTQRIVLATDGPTVTTLNALLNATTLATPASQTITFTINNGASLSAYQQLVGRAWLIFFPAMAGANVKIRVKKLVGDATGDLLYDDTGNPHELFVSSTARAYSSQATAFLSSCIESYIAFESYSDATTTVNQTSSITITLKAVV